MSTLSEVNAAIAVLQPQFDAELAAYRAAVLRCGNHYQSVPADDIAAASAALERLRPIGDQLQALQVERVNLERQP